MPDLRRGPLVRRLLALGLPHLPLMLGVILASSLYSLLSSFLMWLLANVLFGDGALRHDLPFPMDASAGSVLLWGGVVTSLLVLTAVLKSLWAGSVAWRVTSNLRQRLFSHCIELDLGFLQARRAGDLLSRMTGNVQETHLALSFLLNDLLQKPIDILLGLTALVALGYGRIALLGVLALPLLAWPLLLIARRTSTSGTQAARLLGELHGRIHQAFGGIRVVKAFRAEARERAAFDEANRGFLDRMMQVVRDQAAAEGLMELTSSGLFAVGGGLGLLWLVRMGWLPAFQPRDLGICLMIGLQRVLSPMRALIRGYQNFQRTLPGAQRVLELLDAVPALTDAPGAVTLSPLTREIVYENVRFGYGGPAVLKGVSLRIAKGHRVALVGPSGAGKSTLLSLLPRFQDPQGGRILFDGVDLRTATRDSLLGQMAVVGQDPFLFHTTIRENIAYGRPEATASAVEDAARAAHIHEEILALPQGYDTLAGDRGLNLSGGERRRITIARAILKDAPILLLDEATSELDSISERRIQEALERLMAGRTTLVIAHRLSTILQADRIVLMDEGRIVAEDTHAGLLATNGLYRRLHALQFSEPPLPTRT